VASRDQIVEANRATFAAWNAHDPDAVAAVFAPVGMEATGHRIRVEGATFSRFDGDGLVVEDINFWDVGALLAQLGGEQPAG
jgi:hypothetical protein